MSYIRPFAFKCYRIYDKTYFCFFTVDADRYYEKQTHSIQLKALLTGIQCVGRNMASPLAEVRQPCIWQFHFLKLVKVHKVFFFLVGSSFT